METVSLSQRDERALAALLDEIIPPGADGRMPGAGALGLAGRIAADVAKQPDLVSIVQTGLTALDDAASGGCFAELPHEERRDVLARVGETQPALVPSLVFLTYAAYYEHPQVRIALGREPRPPHPGGYELEPFDSTLLDRVRRRAPMYREV